MSTLFTRETRFLDVQSNHAFQPIPHFACSLQEVRVSMNNRYSVNDICLYLETMFYLHDAAKSR